MSETTNPRRTRAPYKIGSKRVWALARARYLAGDSARKVAGDLGLTEYAVRARIRREGWTKRALAEAQDEETLAAVEALDEADAVLWADADGGVDDLSPKATAKRALTLAARLLRQERMAEAAAAARVAEAMSRAAGRLDEDPGDGVVDDEAVFEAVRRKVLGLAAPAAVDGWTAGRFAAPPPSAVPLPVEDGEEMQA